MDKTIRIADEELLLEGVIQDGNQVAFTLNGEEYRFTVSGGEVKRLRSEDGMATGYAVSKDIHKGVLYSIGEHQAWVNTRRRRGAAAEESSDAIYTAPMTGKVLEVLVEAGDIVKVGDKLAVMEAMKLQIAITASMDGEVETVNASEGAMVNEGDVLVALKDDDHA